MSNQENEPRFHLQPEQTLAHLNNLTKDNKNHDFLVNNTDIVSEYAAPDSVTNLQNAAISPQTS